MVVVFNLINNLIPALALGFVLSLVLLVPFFPKTAECGRGKALINTLNEGGRSTAESIFMGAIVVGFASVVQATAAYQVMVDGLLVPAAPCTDPGRHCRGDSGRPHRIPHPPVWPSWCLCWPPT